MQYLHMKNFQEKNLCDLWVIHMNKLMGFLELKEMRLPSIPWKRYTGNEKLDENYLWTIRSAVYRGDDLNLPRMVGKNAKESQRFANELLQKIDNKGIVIYYPYFIANKSGTLEVRNDCIIIEAVKEDLWNLVTYSDREVTVIYRNEHDVEYIGNAGFLQKSEEQQLIKHVPEIRKLFRDDLLQGKSALLEWSYALSCNNKREPVDDEYLVFYEARTI